MTDSKTLVVGGVRLVDPAAADSEPTVCDLVIQSGRFIDIVPPARRPVPDETVDADGRFALPPLVNAHDHLYSHELGHPLPGLGLSSMRAMLDARTPAQTMGVMVRSAWTQLSQGVGVIRDLGAVHGVNIAVSDLFERGVIPGPDVVAAGRPIAMTGGHVWTFGREVDGPWEARKGVREQAKAGARVIKIMASGGLSHYPAEDFDLSQFTAEELVHIVDEAHAVGLPTCAHAFGERSVARAVAAGVDSIEHGVDIDEVTLDAMKRAGTGYVPTLTNMERVASMDYNQSGGTPDRSPILISGVVEPHRRTFQRAVRMGLRIGVGTDSTGDYLAEVLRMESLGMPSADVVRAATVDGALICLRRSNAIGKGSRASFSLYDTDPRLDLHQLTRPSMVFSRGERFSLDAHWLEAPWSSADFRGVGLADV